MKYVQRYRFSCINHTDQYQLNADYMGAAEFEYGSVQSAQDLICETASRMSYIHGMTLEFGEDAKPVKMPLVFVTLEHTFSNGTSYAACAATDIFATVKDSSLRFKERPRFDRLRMEKAPHAHYLPNVWLNIGQIHHNRQKQDQTIEEYRQQHLNEMERILKGELSGPLDPIWLLAPQPHADTILKLFGGHNVLRPETISLDQLHMFDRVVYLTANGEKRDARVVGLPEKGVYLKREGEENRFKVNEKQIVEILPYVKMSA